MRDRGAAAVEYALLTAALVGAVVSAVALGGPIRAAYDCAMSSAATAGVPVYCGPATTSQPADPAADE